jgi:hypothetical protein
VLPFVALTMPERQHAYRKQTVVHAYAMELLSMTYVATAALFLPDSDFDVRHAWWRKFIQALGRRVRALAAARGRRRSGAVHDFVISVFDRGSIALCESAHAAKR